MTIGPPAVIRLFPERAVEETVREALAVSRGGCVFLFRVADFVPAGETGGAGAGPNARRVICARIAAAAAGIEADRVGFGYGPHGKPSVAGIGFNVSWSGGWGVVYASARPAELGIDIEDPARYAGRADDPVRLERLRTTAEHFFLPAENRWLASCGDEGGASGWIGAFLRLWTRKEALVKAWGTSIGSHSFAADLSGDGGTWSVSWNSGRWLVYDVPAPGLVCGCCKKENK